MVPCPATAAPGHSGPELLAVGVVDESEFTARTGVWRIPVSTPFIVGPVNCYLLTRGPLTLVDTGTVTDQSWQDLCEGVRRAGYELADIDRIILTHHHADHVGQCQRIVAISGAEVWGHPDIVAQDRLSHMHDEAAHVFFVDIMREFGVPEADAREAMLLWDKFKTFSEPARIDHAIAEAQPLGDFGVYFVPGHSTTDTLFVNEAEGYTIAGDHLLEDFNPNPLLRRAAPGQPRDRALVEYQASLHRARALPLGVCLPGHGELIDDHHRVIDGILAQHERKNRRLLQMCGEQGIAPYEAAMAFYPGLKLQHLYLALSVAAGQLEVLESRGLMRSERRDGRLRFFKTGEEQET